MIVMTFGMYSIGCLAISSVSLYFNMILKDFLAWIEQDLGPWGPLALLGQSSSAVDMPQISNACPTFQSQLMVKANDSGAVAYIPLTILSVPASVLTLGGGYLFGLPVGFIADSVGATLGAGAAFLLGRACKIAVPKLFSSYYEQLGRSFFICKLEDYPKFRSVTIAIQRSGFKIVLLLRLAPLVPFNLLNYLLSLTPVPMGEYMLASWLGMIPITLALVYVGTTLKDLSDVTHGLNKFSKPDGFTLYTQPTTSASLFLLLLAVILMICVTLVAKEALDKALAEEDERTDGDGTPAEPPNIEADSNENLCRPILVRIDSPHENPET
ncbi:UNVERIFIED_CONTAM: TVP38/TMEM64 family membrane protein [Sesamum calycinum]|uniref:TVP38/TMEM64 family membrane protein n=1 Tax=Sesamum calycinum TaxID=2727403 RepID=A0AAW2QKR8_9LAMI